MTYRRRSLFEQRFGRPPLRAFRAPGRATLIGEHTDYSGGLVLPLAIDRQVVALAAPSLDPIVSVYSLAFDELVRVPLSRPSSLSPRTHRGSHVASLLSALQRRGLSLAGCDVLVDSNLPIGSGLGSSAAFGVALALTFAGLAGRDLPARDLALLCQAAEQEAVGVQCGIMDQLAATLSRRGSALFVDCGHAAHQHVPLDERRVRVVVADSSVRRSLAAADYNARRAEVEQATAWLGRAHGVTSLRDIAPDQLQAVTRAIPNRLALRVRHVVEENQRVTASVAGLQSGDPARLGALMLRSHASLRDLYQVSTPELDALVEVAMAAPGCLGAKLSGAGFGGSTVNLVSAEQVDDFCDLVAKGYRQRTGLTATLYPCWSADGASEMLL